MNNDHGHLLKEEVQNFLPYCTKCFGFFLKLFVNFSGPIQAEMASPGPACVQLPQLLGTKVIDSKRKAAPG